MSQLRIKTPGKISLDQLRFDDLYKTVNGITKAIVTYEGHPLIIQGPKMTLGTSVVQSGDYYYLDLVFKPNDGKNTEFVQLVKNVDYLAISEIFENSSKWYNDDGNTHQIGLCQIEKEFIPSTKLSAVYPDQQSLKLAVKASDIEFFDQDKMSIPHMLLKEGYTTTPLLHVSEVIKEGSHIWVEWKLLQLKTEIPAHLFEQCQLVDVDGSDDEFDEVEPDEFY